MASHVALRSGSFPVAIAGQRARIASVSLLPPALRDLGEQATPRPILTSPSKRMVTRLPLGFARSGRNFPRLKTTREATR